MENTTEMESMQKVREIFQNIQEEFLTTKPVWMRLNLMVNMVSKAISEGHTDADINWKKLNSFLKTNVSEYDFNFFDEINSYQDLCEAAMSSKTNCILGPWQKHVCKDCGKVFYLQYSEVDFFKKKELHVPKRCKECRSKRKAGK